MAHDLLVSDVDPERVSRLRDVSAGLGKAYYARLQSDERVDHRLTAIIAATYFRRSAAHSLLLAETGAASEMFLMASQAYEKHYPSYSVVMSVLARQGAVSFPRILHMTSSGQMIYPMLLALHLHERYLEHLIGLRHHVDSFRGERLGVLAIPVETFIEVFDVLRKGIESKELDRGRLNTALLPFVESYASAFVRAKRDTYHWSRLATPFHPIEPDIVGSLLLIKHILTRLEVPIEKVIARLPVAREPLSVLQHVLSLYDQNRQTSEEDQR